MVNIFFISVSVQKNVLFVLFNPFYLLNCSGQMLASISGDFFGDSELPGLTIEQPLAMDLPYGGGSGGGGGNQTGFSNSLNWEVPRLQIFLHRTSLKALLLLIFLVTTKSVQTAF